MKAGFRRLDRSEEILLIQIKRRKIDDRSGETHGSELDEAMLQDLPGEWNMAHSVNDCHRFLPFLPENYYAARATHRLSQAHHSVQWT